MVLGINVWGKSQETRDLLSFGMFIPTLLTFQEFNSFLNIFERLVIRLTI